MGAPVIAILEAWEAASEATAVAYRVPVAVLRAESRGRGPKPPKWAIEAKQVAIWLTVALADRPYAVIGRALGYHKDTISSHCETVRQLADADELEADIEAIMRAAGKRLAMPDGEMRALPVLRPALLRGMIADLQRRVEALENLLRRADAASDEPPFHPTICGPDEKKVIDLEERRRA